jgi:hypothetical protein
MGFQATQTKTNKQRILVNFSISKNSMALVSKQHISSH